MIIYDITKSDLDQPSIVDYLMSFDEVKSSDLNFVVSDSLVGVPDLDKGCKWSTSNCKHITKTSLS